MCVYFLRYFRFRLGFRAFLWLGFAVGLLLQAAYDEEIEMMRVLIRQGLSHWGRLAIRNPP